MHLLFMFYIWSHVLHICWRATFQRLLRLQTNKRGLRLLHTLGDKIQMLKQIGPPLGPSQPGFVNEMISPSTMRWRDCLSGGTSANSGKPKKQTVTNNVAILFEEMCCRMVSGLSPAPVASLMHSGSMKSETIEHLYMYTHETLWASKTWIPRPYFEHTNWNGNPCSEIMS